MELFGEVDFNKWNDSNIIIPHENNNIVLRNDFMNAGLIDNKNHQKYFYDDEKNILIFYRGIILNGNHKNLLSVIADDYLNDKDFADKLYGFFSIAIIDFNNRKVVLVSDKIGQLKLFYSFNNNILVFSTSLSGFDP